MSDEYNYFGVPHEVIEDAKFKRLPDKAARLYVYFCHLKNRYAREDGYFWRSINTLAEEIGMSRKSVMKAKKELVESGFIECARGKYVHSQLRCPNWYKVNGFKKR